MDPLRVPEALEANRIFGRNALITGASSDEAQETLEAETPVVKVVRILDENQALPRHSKQDTDTHSVASHLDTPSLSTEVSDCCPTFAPSTVRLNDPVAAELRDKIKLTNPSSADTAEVAVPPLEPMLILSQREWLLPRPPKASRHVSAIQKDPSLAVRPTRTLPHAFHSPKPVPNTLTIADPVDTAFPAESTLVLRSASEKPSVKLRDTRPTVDSIRRLLPVP